MDIHWDCCHQKIQDRDVLTDLLPPQYKYRVKQYDLKHESYIRSESKFTAEVLASICTEAQLNQFLESLSGITHSSWKKTQHPDRRNSKTILFSGARKCLNNIRKASGQIPDKIPGKNTDCEARLKFRIVKSSDCDGCEEICRNPKFLCTITLQYLHNHAVDCAQSAMLQPVSDKTKERFHEMFEAGHGASSAYHLYKSEFHSNHQQDYLRAAASRSELPDYRWVAYAYEQ